MYMMSFKDKSLQVSDQLFMFTNTSDKNNAKLSQMDDKINMLATVRFVSSFSWQISYMRFINTGKRACPRCNV